MTTRIVLADDQALVREGLRMVIDSQSDLRVVGEAGTGREAIAAVHKLAPDVLVMDVRMPELDGLTAAHAIVAENQQARIILLTTLEREPYAHEAQRAGVRRFLLKGVPPAELLSAIREVAAGGGN